MLGNVVPSSPAFPIIAVQHDIPTAASKENHRNHARVSLRFEDVNKIWLKLLHLAENRGNSRWR
jgi:hypothetical protein